MTEDEAIKIIAEIKTFCMNENNCSYNDMKAYAYQCKPEWVEVLKVKSYRTSIRYFLKSLHDDAGYRYKTSTAEAMDNYDIARKTKIEFYENIDEKYLKFAVIVAKTIDSKWVLCKHKKRETLEFPGGHREAGESIMETASRELYEETGAIEFEINPVCYYSVASPDYAYGEKTFGLLCYAEISEFEKELHSEIEKIIITDDLPDNWTYPLTYQYLLNELKNRNII